MTFCGLSSFCQNAYAPDYKRNCISLLIRGRGFGLCFSVGIRCAAVVGCRIDFVRFLREVGFLIYTVTFNPAIDYTMHFDGIRQGFVNRAVSESISCGGKGINVSVVLSRLGVKSAALGFIAGESGRFIENELKSHGIKTDFVFLKNGFSRINVKIKADVETDLNGNGPFIDEVSVAALYRKLDRLCASDTLVLAGSIPVGLSQNTYEHISRRMYEKGVRTVVDATGELLLNTLKYKPFLIKPNHFELGEIFGVDITDASTAAIYAKKLQARGAQNVLVSMGAAGAVLCDCSGKTYFSPAFRGEVKNSVGAGDSMIAGFLAGLAEGDTAYALKLATAAGGATAFSEELARAEDIYALLSGIAENTATTD